MCAAAAFFTESNAAPLRPKSAEVLTLRALGAIQPVSKESNKMSQFFQTLEKTIWQLVEREGTAGGLHNLFFVIPAWSGRPISVNMWPCAINPEGLWPSRREQALTEGDRQRQAPCIKSDRLSKVEITASDKLPSQQFRDPKAYPGSGINSSFTLSEHVRLDREEKCYHETAMGKLCDVLKRYNSMPPNKRRALHVSALFFVYWCRMGANGEHLEEYCHYVDTTLLQYYDPSGAAQTEPSLNEHLLLAVPVMQDAVAR
jgi:hypothetical protein